MKILGIDFGTKRIGLAISDETQTLARELSILSPQEFWDQIEVLLADEAIEKVVLGMPVNMSGEKTQKSEEVKEFADELQSRISVSVEMVDERLSSVMAENLSGQMTGQHEQIDSLAAQIFLQNYLNQNKN